MVVGRRTGATGARTRHLGPDLTPSVSGGEGDILRLEAVTKRYGTFTAVDGIDLAVPKGQIFGFLGPNGAGKTTTIRLLLGLMHPTRGKAEINGQRVDPRSPSLRRSPRLRRDAH